MEIQITGSANIITFLPYYRGAVPVQMINDTAIAIQFHQNSRHVKHRPICPMCTVIMTELIVRTYIEMLLAHACVIMAVNKLLFNHSVPSNVHNVYVLPPDQSLMYTWDDPLSNREIITKNLVQPQRSQSFQFSVQVGMYV